MTTSNLVPFRSFPCSLVGVKTRPSTYYYEVPGRFLVSVKTCQDKAAACQGVKVLSPDIFGARVVYK